MTTTPSGIKGKATSKKPTLPKQDWAAKFRALSDQTPSTVAAFGSDFEQPMTMDHVPHPAYWAMPPGVDRHPDYDVFGADNIPEGVNRTFGGGEVEDFENHDALSEGYTTKVANDGRSSSFGLGVVIPSTYKPKLSGPNPEFGAFEGQHVPFGHEGARRDFQGQHIPFGAEAAPQSKSWLVGVLGILGIWLGYEWMEKKIKRQELLARLHGGHSRY